MRATHLGLCNVVSMTADDDDPAMAVHGPIATMLSIGRVSVHTASSSDGVVHRVDALYAGGRLVFLLR